MLDSPNPKHVAEIEQIQRHLFQLQTLVYKQQTRLHYLEQRTNLIGSSPLLAANNKFENWLEDLCRFSDR